MIFLGKKAVAAGGDTLVVFPDDDVQYDYFSDPADYTVDLSQAEAGDTVYVFYGGGGTAGIVSSVTISGESATEVDRCTGAGEAEPILFSRTLTTGGTASDTISVDVTSTQFDNFMCFFIVKGSHSTTTDDAYDATGVSVAGTVTPTNATNAVITFVNGREGSFNGSPSWTNGTQRGIIDADSDHGCAWASSLNVPVSAYTQTFTGDTTGPERMGSLTIQISRTA